MMARFCEYCGKDIKNTDVFCPYCGSNPIAVDSISAQSANAALLKHKAVA